jgi:hypothetical protein
VPKTGILYLAEHGKVRPAGKKEVDRYGGTHSTISLLNAMSLSSCD